MCVQINVGFLSVTFVCPIVTDSHLSAVVRCPNAYKLCITLLILLVRYTVKHEASGRLRLLGGMLQLKNVRLMQNVAVHLISPFEEDTGT